MDHPLASDEELNRAEDVVTDWLERQQRDNPVIAAVDRGAPDERRWYVRLKGEEKDFITVWFVLGQRTLQYETYLAPAPEENHAAFYEHLLRRNAKLNGMALSIGVEDAVYLRGQIGVRHIDEPELDRILGSLYEYSERFFRPAMRIGYASRFMG
ncbi:MAG: YbjN domain-containing protein [Acidimicrobiales bacterium]